MAGKEDPNASIESMDGDPRMDGAQSPENKENKKKRFKPFKAMRRLFSTKRHKCKDDRHGSLKSKSTSELLEAQKAEDGKDGPPTPLTTSMSFSAESVFTQNKKEGDLRGLKDSSRSMEHIHKQQFSSELFNKVKHRLGSDDDIDDGLPHSPIGSATTADFLIEDGLRANPNKSMSQDSERSLFGMDSSENEEDFFTSWSPNGSRDLTQDTSKMDLNYISSNTSLNVSAAKHRISVAPKTRRASSKHKKTQSHPNIRKQLSKVDETPSKEKSQISDSKKDESLDVTVKSKPSVIVKEVNAQEKNDSKVRFTPDTTDNKSDTADGVVLRRKKELSENDPSKRRTVAEVSPGKNSSSVFGEKVKRASSYEMRNWEELGKPKESPNSEDTGTSEFALAFSKMRNKTDNSKKPEQDKCATTAPSVQGEVASTKSSSVSFKANNESKTNEVKQLVIKAKEEVNKKDNIPKQFTIETAKKEETVSVAGKSKESASSSVQPPSSLNINTTSESSPYKKTTPVQKPRWRSKTLPEQPVTKETLRPDSTEKSVGTNESLKLKRSSSQHSDKSPVVSKVTSPTSPERKNSLVQPSNQPPEPKKLVIKDTGGGDGPVPDWVLMVRKRKQGKDDDGDDNVTDKEKGEKEKKESLNSSVKRTEGSVPKTENKTTIVTNKQKTTESTSSTPPTSSSSSNVNSDVKTQEKPVVNKNWNVTSSSTSSSSSSNSKDIFQIGSKSTDESKLIKTKEETKPDLSKTLKQETENKPCGNDSSSNRKSSVLDMVKNFQKLQVN